MTDAPKQFAVNEPIPLEIRRGGIEGADPSAYSIKLAGVEVGMHLAVGGFKVEFEDDGVMPGQPTVTLRFSPLATTVDLDAELIGYLREKDARG